MDTWSDQIKNDSPKIPLMYKQKYHRFLHTGDLVYKWPNLAFPIKSAKCEEIQYEVLMTLLQQSIY